MQNIVDIKNRIKSIKETGQITKAMELISVSKMRKANENYQRNLAYSSRVKSVLKNILTHSGGALNHPYFIQRQGDRTAYIVIASDTGMAGDYNHRVLSFADKKIDACKNSSTLVIGQMATAHYESRGMTPDVQFFYCSQNPTLDDARRITADMVNLYDNDVIDEAKIIYTTTANGVVNKAVEQRLLPILREDFLDVKTENDYVETMTFEPSPKEVFDILIPQYVLGLTYTALIQAVRCEHSERMSTMNNATKNAEEMISHLEQQYHRARQEQITTEIAELSSFKH